MIFANERLHTYCLYLGVFWPFESFPDLLKKEKGAVLAAPFFET